MGVDRVGLQIWRSADRYMSSGGGGDPVSSYMQHELFYKKGRLSHIEEAPDEEAIVPVKRPRVFLKSP